MNRLVLERSGCDEVGDQLSEYLDEELGALDHARVVLHLTAYPRCAAMAVGLAETIQAVHRLSGRIG